MDVHSKSKEVIVNTRIEDLDYNFLAQQQGAYLEKMSKQLEHELPIAANITSIQDKELEKLKRSMLDTQRIIGATLENIKKIRMVQKTEVPEQPVEVDDGSAELIQRAREMMEKK